MKRKIAVFLLTLCLFSIFAPLTVNAENYPKEDDLTSGNVAVFNVEKGCLVYGKSEHTKVAPGHWRGNLLGTY